MRGSIDASHFSASVLEGLCKIIEEEMLALYFRLSPAVKQRLQEIGKESSQGSASSPEKKMVPGGEYSGDAAAE